MKSTKRALESARKKNILFQTALALFSEYGYKQLSTEKIALEAGISKGLLFTFYGSKKELYSKVIDYKLHEIRLFVTSRVNLHDCPLEKLADTFRSGFIYVEKNPDIFLLAGKEARLIAPEVLINHRSYWQDLFTTLIHESVEKKLIKNQISVELISKIFYSMHEKLMEDILTAQDTSVVPSDIVETTIDIFFHGILT